MPNVTDINTFHFRSNPPDFFIRAVSVFIMKKTFFKPPDHHHAGVKLGQKFRSAEIIFLLGLAVREGRSGWREG